jgi:hypothetical protein
LGQAAPPHTSHRCVLPLPMRCCRCCIAGQLRHQELSAPQNGWPLSVLAKGPDVAFTAGSPIVAWGPEIPGFTRLIGRGLFTHGRFNCTGSLRRATQYELNNGRRCCCCRPAGLPVGLECWMIAGRIVQQRNIFACPFTSPSPAIPPSPAVCRPVVQECVRAGSIDALAQLCLQDSSCEAFIYKPGECCTCHTALLSCC